VNKFFVANFLHPLVLVLYTQHNISDHEQNGELQAFYLYI